MSDAAATNPKSPRKLFVPSLALLSFSEQNLSLLVGLFLLDIAVTFQVTVGEASQLIAISKVTAIFVGLLMGALSVRFRHKSLLLLGSLSLTIGIVGCIIAPNFTYMQLFFPFDGIGSVAIAAMAAALIGEYLPLEKRSKALGFIIAAGSLAWVIGAPICGVIAGAGGWRLVLLLFCLPIAAAGLVLAFYAVPSKPTAPMQMGGRESYLSSFKQVLFNRSAVACLVGNLFSMALSAWSVFIITFYRTNFSLSLEFAFGILILGTFFFATGGFVSGRLINRYGRKPVTAFCAVARSVMVVLIVFMPTLWLALVFDIANTVLSGIGLAAGSSLGLEQVPKARGTMMSIVAVFGSLGIAVGTFAGGYILDAFGFQVLAPALAVMGLACAAVVYFFAVDPNRVSSAVQAPLKSSSI